MTSVATDLIARARTGDDEAFRQLTEPTAASYTCIAIGCSDPSRMLRTHSKRHFWLPGADSADSRNAPRSAPGSTRSGTNRCLNARRSASRRPAKEWDVPNVEPPEPTTLGEVPWLEPHPDALLHGAVDMPPGPEALYEQTESISLAFVTALQVLPPRQLAVLVLRDVLGFRAKEVADMLGSTVESVNSALKRARTSLERRWLPVADHEPTPLGSGSEDAVMAKFVRAWESADLNALVSLLTDDVFISMPPLPFEYEGRVAVAGSAAASSPRHGTSTSYRREPMVSRHLGRTCAHDGIRHGVGLFVLALAGDQICAMTRFESSVFPSFGLPRSLG